MTYTDIEYIKDLNIGIYELLNKKADHNAAEDYLKIKVYFIIIYLNVNYLIFNNFLI